MSKRITASRERLFRLRWLPEDDTIYLFRIYAYLRICAQHVLGCLLAVSGCRQGRFFRFSNTAFVSTFLLVELVHIHAYNYPKLLGYCDNQTHPLNNHNK